ncbi:Type III secretion system effector HopBA1 [Pseudomonas coronafaciens]|uniref:Type III secretion system effector HopBA1 n=1 Tax=Pseudomonas syringae group TaxID=136849 RepID=UPI000EFDB6C2|nr:Type III secretion system effector HopBA1 [Pseudomonas tremae]MCF5810795.1 Type III secretion system effector HopBA1 [Pseudomonas tremae]
MNVRPPRGGPVDSLVGAASDNKLVYIGDEHGEVFIPKLIAESAKKLKNAGVDHLAVEFVKHSDGAAFREALSYGKSAVNNFLEASWGQHGDAWLDKVSEALCCAHGAGIHVSVVDRKMVVEQPKTAMQKILYMKKRLALNAAWDATAAREASAVCANKSMVWGGAGHFSNSKIDGLKDMRPGLVISFDLTGSGFSRINDADEHSHIVISGENN